MIKKITFKMDKNEGLQNLIMLIVKKSDLDTLDINNIVYNKNDTKDLYLNKKVIVDMRNNTMRINKEIDEDNVNDEYIKSIKENLIYLFDSKLKEAKNIYSFILAIKIDTKDIDSKLIIGQNDKIKDTTCDRIFSMEVKDGYAITPEADKISYDTFKILQDDFIEISFE